MGVEINPLEWIGVNNPPTPLFKTLEVREGGGDKNKVDVGPPSTGFECKLTLIWNIFIFFLFQETKMESLR